MSFEINLISSLVSGSDFTIVKDKGLSLDEIDPAFLPVWAMLESHHKQYGKLPSKELIEAKFEITLPNPIEPANFWIKEIQNKSLLDRLNELGISTNKAMQKSDATAARELLRDFIKREDARKGGISSFADIQDMKDIVLQRYLDAKDGKRGIPTPWPTINEWTMGWWKKDLSFWVARTGVGKTFICVNLALAAQSAGYKVLIISCEMTKEDIATRLYSFMFKASYGLVRKGKLSIVDERRFKEELMEYNNPYGICVMDGSSGMSTDHVEAVIERSDADLVVVDSMYRIKARQKTINRTDNVAFVADDLKLYGQKYDKAMVATTQLSRKATEKKSEEAYELEDISLSDVISWNSTNVLGLRRVNATEMEAFPMKVRESAKGNSSLKIKWDFVNMDFRESLESANDVEW